MKTEKQDPYNLQGTDELMEIWRDFEEQLPNKRPKIRALLDGNSIALEVSGWAVELSRADIRRICKIADENGLDEKE